MHTEERKAVGDLLRKFGITPRYKGYLYVVEAVLLYRQYSETYIMVTKDVYPTIAKKFNDSSSNVERNIRLVIARCWGNNKELLTTIANYPLPEKPSNSEFLDILTYYVSLLID